MKRKSKIAIFLIVGGFALVNVIWFTTIKMQYASYQSIVPLNEEFNVRHVDNNEKNLSYGYDTPGYLRLTGNLYYTQKFPEDKIAYTFIIWPKLFKDEEYGVIVHEQGEAYQIEITSTLDVRGKDIDDPFSKELLENHHEQLETVLADARETFKLND